MAESNVRTITVAGHFGDKQVTCPEFKTIWVNHVRELRRLDYSTEWQQQVDKMVETVGDKAEAEFEAMHEKQANEAIGDILSSDNP